ncbi:MAG: efflux RND transporter permease subunit [Dokdonella sp.]
MTPEKLIEELDRSVHLLGLTNLWVLPNRNRLDMLATGIESPVGIKIGGSDLATIDATATAIEHAVKVVLGVTSALAERLSGGRYIVVEIDSDAASRYALNIDDVQGIVSAAIGGETIGETVEERRRFPISVRYPREMRDSVHKLRDLPVLTLAGAQLPSVLWRRLASPTDDPPVIKSENGRLSGWIYVDLRGRDITSVVRDMRTRVAHDVQLPAGVSVTWSGQFEYLEHAIAKLRIVILATLVIIFVLLYFTFGRLDEAFAILASVPFALVGGFWFIYVLGHAMSVATAVGFIALAGVSAEFGVVMFLNLKPAWERRLAAGEPATAET